MSGRRRCWPIRARRRPRSHRCRSATDPSPPSFPGCRTRRRTAWRRLPAGCRAACRAPCPRSDGREGLLEFRPPDPQRADALRSRPAGSPCCSRLTAISANANRPMVMATKPMPSISSGMLKEKRAMPELTSVPTMPSSRPRIVMQHGLEHRAARQRHGRDQAEHHQREILGGVELEREVGQRRREGGDDQRRDAAGEERPQRRDAQRRPGPALPRHLVAVEHGDDRRHLARQIDQDRGRRAAVGGAVVDAGQHDQRRHRRQPVGRSAAAWRWSRPDRCPATRRSASRPAPDEGIEQVDRRERDAEAQEPGWPGCPSISAREKDRPDRQRHAQAVDEHRHRGTPRMTPLTQCLLPRNSWLATDETKTSARLASDQAQPRRRQ